MSCPALIVIDLQNDYFPDGAFPLWNTEDTLNHVLAAIRLAQNKGIPVIHVQHVADPRRGTAPLFNLDTHGVAIHNAVLAAAPDAPVIVKHFADAFLETSLDFTLQRRGIDELLICGMMTQNCVTHTAISPAAAGYKVSILIDCCTTVSEPIHKFALNAVAPRLALVHSGEILADFSAG